MRMKEKKRSINLKVFLICIAIVYLSASIGSIFTTSKTQSSWYNDIKPSLTPPNWVFPIVWNFLFLLISISLYTSWMKMKNNSEKKKLSILFGINLLLNVVWSLLYFGMQNPALAFIDLLFLFVSILSIIIFLWNKNKKGAFLLFPYLLWISFAGILNYLSIA